MARRTVLLGAIAAVAIAGGWWLWSSSRRAASGPTATTPLAQTPADARKITATLYFVSEDGMSLVGVQREVAFGETVLDQAREIVNAQLAAAPAPLPCRAINSTASLDVVLVFRLVPGWVYPSITTASAMLGNGEPETLIV